MRVLVTGATGFVGRHLLPALVGRYPDARVCAWAGVEAGPSVLESRTGRLDQVDLCDAAQVQASVRDFGPTHLVHLAAISNVPLANTDPSAAFEVNAMGTLRLLEAVRRHAPQCRVQHVSSSDIYGRSFRAGSALDESAMLAPENAYATSKAASDLIAQQYGHGGLEVVVARPFNHIGPGQADSFAIPSFARQIARIEHGLQPPVVSVGNLEAQRDFTDVRDVVQAYLALLEGTGDGRTNPQVFNIASGQPRSIGSVLEDLLARAEVTVDVRPDPERMRPSDTPLATGDSSALRAATGWRPERSWDQTLQDVLDDWRLRTAERA